MNRYPDEQLVFITTGSQGESMAALSHGWLTALIKRCISSRVM